MQHTDKSSTLTGRGKQRDGNMLMMHKGLVSLSTRTIKSKKVYTRKDKHKISYLLN